jgi:hypothetical protein
VGGGGGGGGVGGGGGPRAAAAPPPPPPPPRVYDMLCKTELIRRLKDAAHLVKLVIVGGDPRPLGT